MKLNLYHVYQDENRGYDTYDSMVVCAKDENQARQISPGGGAVFMTLEAWEDSYSAWASHPSKLKVRCLGAAAEGEKIGLICASFNAGCS